MKVIRTGTNGPFSAGIGHYAQPKIPDINLPLCEQYEGKTYHETDDLVLCLQCRVLTNTLPSQKQVR